MATITQTSVLKGVTHMAASRTPSRRQALRWTFAGYTLLGLSYFGSKLILENILGKHWG